VKPKDHAAASILNETLKHLKKKPLMQQDVSRLSSACSALEKYELLQKASPTVISGGV
jgi:hypothetical protein